MRKEYVFDLETKYSFDEVGGRDRMADLGVSYIGFYAYHADEFFGFRENELEKLNPLLQDADLLIGFNINGFDLPVLSPHVSVDLKKIPVVDIFDDVVAVAGHRVGLESLAVATLGARKLGHGLDALKWHRAGDWENLEKYCLQDVRLTRDLYEYGKKHGHLLFNSIIDGRNVAVPVKWNFSPDDEVRARLADAFEQGKAVEIDYVSREDAGEGFQKTRKVEVRKIFNETVEAYCHLRKDVRQFRIGRILNARILQEAASAPRTLF